jgi:2-dehydro-3-deoxyphosphogluconate aldolase/(4S)-4-hydroxy-2-oxoglutarate aldolase
MTEPDRKTQALLQHAGRAPVIPVVAVEDPADGPPLARALVAAGLPVVEVTLRTPRALAVIEAIARDVPDAVVAAGTVTRADQIAAVERAGARLIVTPGTPDRLAQALAAGALPAMPGCATASEAMALADLGFQVLKCFPAGPSGGPAFLKALHGPLPHLLFCPTGGVTAENAPDYLACPNVVCVGGTWMAPARALAGRDFAEVEHLARAAAALPRGAGLA